MTDEIEPEALDAERKGIVALSPGWSVSPGPAGIPPSQLTS